MVPRKIFCIGFQKTGTSSLGRALRDLGYRLAPEFDFEDPEIATTIRTQVPALVEQFDAFEDNPWPLLFRDLDRGHPGSKFILSVRAEDRWIESALAQFSGTSSPMREWVYGSSRGDPSGNEELWLNRFRQHNQDVLEHFADRPDDLLVFNLENGDGWEALCSFLGHHCGPRPSRT